MKKVTVTIDDYLYAFYQKIGSAAGGLSPERVMADALFKLAGELARQGIGDKARGQTPPERPLP